jgi:unsaturated rhamnogalacturonyl hydrolase
MRKYLIVIFLIISTQLHAQKWSQQLATTAMKMWPDSFAIKPGTPAKWHYDQGVILKGIEGIWTSTGEGKWFDYIQHSMDFYVKDDGTIRGYKPDEYNIDHVNNGKLLLTLYRVTGKEKYWKAATALRNQLRTHPRTSEGGFWHKKIYPSQMWLDGLYMGQPFYAEYAMLTGEDTIFNDVARQFILMEKYARDAKTGLLYHGWDESRQQQWANKTTGLSPNVWGRALGWFGMAMVDALDYFPEKHPGRDSIIGILNRFAAAVSRVQDKKTGLWYDVVNLPKEPRNYFEASASSMLVYAFAKGVRKGYLPATYLKNAKNGYNGIIKRFIKTENGQVNLHGTVSVSGLGGKPYRDGSFDYYMSEPVIVNDPKGMGAFIKASVEIELMPKLEIGKGKKFLLDNYFNRETKKDISSRTITHHYTLDDRTNGGYSLLGTVLNYHGISTTQTSEPPSASLLKQYDIYMIVDPDWPKENKTPNYIQQLHINAIYEWVKQGGILLMFANDSNNVEFVNFNKLASNFGINFNDNIRNTVEGSKFEQATVIVPPGHEIFKTAKELYIKEFGTLTVHTPARVILTHKGDNVMAVSKIGKGTVFAIGDPWLYNEYVDGRKLPAELDNYQAIEDLIKWLVKQSPRKKN